MVGKHVQPKNIFDKLSDGSTELYVNFLNFMLSFLNDLNLEMQAETFKMNTLYSKMKIVKNVMLNSIIYFQLI